ncbi:MAG: 5-histidylcysteine sulfoxide synthase [Alphaproteobacteria bacterium]|nr:5-histidylcysteine sulfoxide synthase [Alphaproteobacteria bacterium]
MTQAPAGPHHALIVDVLDRDALRAHVLQAWRLTDWLFSGLADDDVFQLQPDPLRNPLVFYFGHTAAFSLNKLGLAGLVERPLDAGLQHLLAVGVDPAAASELDTAVPWPTAAEVRDFRAAALPMVLDAIDALDAPPRWDNAGWAVLMGSEHDRIHFETSSVLIRQLPLDAVRAPVGWQVADAGPAPDERRVQVDGGSVVLGKPAAPMTYGWDNEFGRLSVDVAPFTVGATLVDNAAFLRFVQAGGYEDRTLWTDEGWAWVQEHGVTAPRFWRGDDDGLQLRGVFRRRPLPQDWPVEVNHHEATAYCRWRGARLPTESEWALLARGAARARGDAAFHDAHHLQLAACSPRGVAAGPPDARGIHDAVGNVWQWLADDFRPLPGFRPHAWYPDFSEPYFDPQHKAMRGGSWASTGATASEHYRLWFRPHFYQHAGFRLAWDQASA